MSPPLTSSDGEAEDQWAERLLAVSSALLAVAIIFLWVRQFYQGAAPNAVLSYGGSDAPYMPGGLVPHTILGIHYFGDFQIEYGYGHLLRTGLSPYLGSYIHDDQSPLSAALFSVLSFVRLTRAAFVYFVITIAGILVPTWFLLRPWRATRRVMFLSIVGLLSLGSIATLDRGNDLGITFGLIALSCLGWKMERFWICGAALALAIAFKGYPAALLIVPLGLRRYRFAVTVAASALMANLAVLIIFPGGYVSNLRNVVPALTSLRLHTGTQLLSWNIYSLVPKFVGLVSGPDISPRLTTPNSNILWLFSVGYLVVVWFIVARQRVPQWCWGPLALASLQVVVTLSYAYATIWAFLGCIWFACGNLVPVADPLMSDRRAKLLRYSVLAMLAVTSAPSAVQLIGVQGYQTPLTQLLSPLLVIWTLGLALFCSIASESSIGNSSGGNPTALDSVDEAMTM